MKATWIADDVSAASLTDTPGKSRMMNGYLDNANGNPSTVMFSGLAAGKYTIYVYTNSGFFNFVSSTNTFQIGGPGLPKPLSGINGEEGGAFSGTFVEVIICSLGNYVLFKEITVFSGFTSWLL